MVIKSEKAKNRIFNNILDVLTFNTKKIKTRKEFSENWKQWFYLENGNVVMAIDKSNNVIAHSEKEINKLR